MPLITANAANDSTAETKTKSKTRNRSKQQRSQSKQQNTNSTLGTITNEQFDTLVNLFRVTSNNVDTLTNRLDTLEQQLHAIILMLQPDAAALRYIAPSGYSSKKHPVDARNLTPLQAKHQDKQELASMSSQQPSNQAEFKNDNATSAISHQNTGTAHGEVTSLSTTSTVYSTSTQQPAKPSETKQHAANKAFLDLSGKLVHSINAIKETLALQTTALAPHSSETTSEFTKACFGLLRQQRAVKTAQLMHLPESDVKLELRFDATGANAKDNSITSVFQGFEWSTLSQSGEFFNRTIIFTKKTNGSSILNSLPPILSFISELALLDIVLHSGDISFDLNDIMHMTGYRNQDALPDNDDNSGEDDEFGSADEAGLDY
jgi:hypothetical protein